MAAGGCWAAQPDASALLAKARKALGQQAPMKSLVVAGAHKVATLDPMTKESRISSREMTLSVLFPARFLREETMDLPMGGPGPVVMEGFDGEKAWTHTRQQPGINVVLRMGGPNVTEEMKARRMHEMFARYLLAMTLTTQADFPVEFNYGGQAEAPDGKADVLDAKGPGGFAMRVFLDSESHLPLLLSYQAPEQRVITTRRIAGHGDQPDPDKIKAEAAAMPKPAMVEYQVRPSDYKKVGGAMLPHAITWTVAGKVVEEIEVKKYTVNGSLAPEIFRKP